MGIGGGRVRRSPPPVGRPAASLVGPADPGGRDAAGPGPRPAGCQAAGRARRPLRHLHRRGRPAGVIRSRRRPGQAPARRPHEACAFSGQAATPALDLVLSAALGALARAIEPMSPGAAAPPPILRHRAQSARAPCKSSESAIRAPPLSQGASSRHPRIPSEFLMPRLFRLGCSAAAAVALSAHAPARPRPCRGRRPLLPRHHRHRRPGGGR